MCVLYVYMAQLTRSVSSSGLDLLEVPGEGGGGHSGTEGGRTRVTYFAEEGVIF